MRGFARMLRRYGELCKPRISCATTLSAGAGFLLAGGRVAEMGIALAGVFLLACGVCCLNQYQDRRIDRLMPRTEGRPLPSGRIRPVAAAIFSAALTSGGAFLLLREGLIPFMLGLCAVLWYNGLYTYLKRRTALAVIPGAAIGALPVAIGWVSAGGVITDPRLFFLCFFFFMWQVPHFWLFAGRHGEEYKKAGLPSVAAVFSDAQLSRINFVWLTAAGVSCIFLATAGIARNSGVNLILLGFSLWIMWHGRKLLGKEAGAVREALAFNKINIYMLAVTLALAADRFV
jgi:protoheme IX farnesyltransferase